jgi:hypothetical protein
MEQNNVLGRVIKSIFVDLFEIIFIRNKKKYKNEEMEDIEVVGSNTYKRKRKGYLNIAIKELREHSFIVGSSGSGKSVFLKRIIRQFLYKKKKYREEGNDYLDKNTKIMIHDTKIDYTKEFYTKEDWIILNPFDKRGYGFNCFRFMKSFSDIERFCRNIAPETEKGEPIWPNSTVEILTGILYTCIHKGEMTNADILRYIEMDYKTLAYAISYIVPDELGADGKPVRKVYKGAEFAYTHLTSSQAGNLYSNFTSNVSFFKNFASCERELDIDDYVRNDKRNLLLVNPDKLKAVLSPIHTILLAEIATIILDLEEDPTRNLVFILDEFSSLKKSVAILDLLKLGRSFGAILFIGIQELAPLEAKWEKEVETFLNNTRQKFIFSISGPNTQKQLCDIIGTQELKLTNDSNSSGIESNKDGISNSTQRIEKNAVINSDIAVLKANEFFFIQRRAAETLKNGSTIKYVARIQGGIDKEIDTREIIAEGFIEREDLKLTKVIEYFKNIDNGIVNKPNDIQTNIPITKTEVIKEEIVGQVLNGPDEEISKEIKENKKMNNEEINKIKEKLLLKKDIKKNEETLIKKEEKNISDLFESYNEDEEDSILKDFQDQINSLDEKDNPYN